MKYYQILIGVIVVLVMAACSNGSSNEIRNSDNNNSLIRGSEFLIEKPTGDKTISDLYLDPTPDWTWDLIAGQNKNVGTVKVWNSQIVLYVKYQTNNGWLMKDVHAYVGPIIPSGVPGQYPLKQEFSSPVSEYTFEIPLKANMASKSNIYIAAHASVIKNEIDETAWGGYWNNGFPKWDFGFKNKWGGGFASKTMPTYEFPPNWVEYWASHPGTYSYWDINFDASRYPDGNYVVNPKGNAWVGWCVDGTHSMYANRNYKVKLLSCYDPELPDFAKSDNWDLISYMITQRRAGKGFYEKDWKLPVNKNTFQYVVWYFMGDATFPSGYEINLDLAKIMIEDAKLRGENFIPSQGQYFGVILFPDTSNDSNLYRSQMNIIEVDP